MSLLVAIALLGVDFLPILPMEVGAVGKFPYPVDVPAGYPYCTTVVKSVTSKDEMVVEVQTYRGNRKDARYWVVLKFNTKNIVDGADLQFTDTFKVIGTQAVPLAGGGARTVFALEVVRKP